MNINSDMDNILEYFLEKVRKRLGKHLRHVILFGSRARGDQVSQSDYDCLVVVDESSGEINNIIDEVAGEVLYTYSAVVSAFVVSEQKIAERTQNPFLMNVIREGIEL